MAYEMERIKAEAKMAEVVEVQKVTCRALEPSIAPQPAGSAFPLRMRLVQP